jgi:hypothetical protein
MVKHLSETMVAHGIPPPIDRTPSLLIGNRTKEIGAWLLENAGRLSPKLRWIAIDDLRLQGLGRHFVRTRPSGLTERDVCRAVALLGTSSTPSSIASTDSPSSCCLRLHRSSGLLTEEADESSLESLSALADALSAPDVTQESTLSGTVEFKRMLTYSASLDGQAGDGSQDGNAVMLSELERAADSMDLPPRLPAYCDCTFCCDYARCSSSCRAPKSPFRRLARKYSII